MNHFNSEKSMFYYLPLIAEGEKSISFQTDSYWIAKSDKDYPTWIWTKDNITKEEVEELKELIKKYFLTPGKNSFNSKKEIWEELSKEYRIERAMEMGYLECRQLSNIAIGEGFIDHPNYGDKIKLAKFWQDFKKFMNPKKEYNFTDCLKEVEQWYETDRFYVWRNKQGKVVSMACYDLQDNIAKISHVYTPEEERNKGYCQSLIYELTKQLLKKNYLPMLYTDYGYQPSNYAYQKVGYKNKGNLMNYTIQK